MISNEKRELIESALEVFNTVGWKEVILPEFTDAYDKLLIDLQKKGNDRDTDLYIKGQIEVLKVFIDLKSYFKKQIE